MKLKYIILLGSSVLFFIMGAWKYFSDFQIDDKSRFVFEDDYQYEGVHFYRNETVIEFSVLYDFYVETGDQKYADDFFVKLRKYVNKLPKEAKYCDNIDYSAFLRAEYFLLKNKKYSAPLKKMRGYQEALDLLSQLNLMVNGLGSFDCRTDLVNRNDLFYKDSATTLLQNIYDAYKKETNPKEKIPLANFLARTVFRYYILTVNGIIEPYIPYEEMSKKIMKESFQEKDIIYERMMNPLPIVPPSEYLKAYWSVPKKYEKMTEWRYRRLVDNFISWGTRT